MLSFAKLDFLLAFNLLHKFNVVWCQEIGIGEIVIGGMQNTKGCQNTSLQRAETTEAHLIEQSLGSPVRTGPTLCLWTIRSPMWAITTTAGILLAVVMTELGALLM